MAKRPRLSAPDDEAASASAADAAALAFRQLVRAEAQAMIAEELPRLVEAEVQRQLRQILPVVSSGQIAGATKASDSPTTLTSGDQCPPVLQASICRDEVGSSSGVIKLHVGPDRKKFTTTADTLARWEGSFFEPLVSGRHTTRCDS